ncbi:hypothetical protein [Prauserella flavalba]|nr:hypothetical protein [Prauserella flavalba]
MHTAIRVTDFPVKEPLEMQIFVTHGGDIITGILAHLANILGWLV